MVIIITVYLISDPGKHSLSLPPTTPPRHPHPTPPHPYPTPPPPLPHPPHPSGEFNITNLSPPS